MDRSNVLDADGFKINLMLMPLKNIRIHEEVLPNYLSDLTESIRQSGVQLDPIIADIKTGIALDGMHRIESIRKLECKRIMVAGVDYSDPRITLKRWLRSVKLPAGIFDELRYNLQLTRASSMEEARSLVDSGASPIAVLSKEESFITSIKAQGLEYFKLVRRFDALTHGLTISSILDINLKEYIDGGYKVLYVPTPKKDDVIFSGMSGTLFPPKSTRHLIPLRPVNVMCPLDLLKGRLVDHEAEERFNELLSTKSRSELPPGSEYKGRTYEERLTVFNDRQS